MRYQEGIWWRLEAYILMAVGELSIGGALQEQGGAVGGMVGGYARLENVRNDAMQVRGCQVQMAVRCTSGYDVM